MIPLRQLKSVISSCVLFAGCSHLPRNVNNSVYDFRDKQCIATRPAEWGVHDHQGPLYKTSSDNSISAIIMSLKPHSPLSYRDLATPLPDAPSLNPNHEVIIENGDLFVVRRSSTEKDVRWTIYLNSAHVCSLMITARTPVEYTSVIRPILMTLREDVDLP